MKDEREREEESERKEEAPEVYVDDAPRERGTGAARIREEEQRPRDDLIEKERVCRQTSCGLSQTSVSSDEEEEAWQRGQAWSRHSRCSEEMKKRRRRREDCQSEKLAPVAYV